MSPTPSRRAPAVAACCVALVILSCKPAAGPTPPPEQQDHPGPSGPAEDLAAARGRFTTTLRVKGPAPQPYQNGKPPPGVRQVEYKSGNLKLQAWASADPGDGRKRPAVVYLHGGFAFGDG